MHPEFSDASEYLVSIHSAPFLVDPFVFVRDPTGFETRDSSLTRCHSTYQARFF